VGEEVTPAVSRERGSNGQRWKTTDSGGPPVGEGKREAGVPVRERFPGPRACFLFGPNRFPEVQFQIFISPSSFLFFCFLFPL
jgi:hypothetical protein